MSVTVREALAMKEWKDCRLIAGEEGLDREIHYIDSMEVPDIIPWLKKDELLITTAYAVRDSEEQLLNIIRALGKNQSAGIALKTKFLGTIPDSIKKIADELKLPVIEIPRDMPAIDLTNPLMKKIVNSQNRKLEFNKAMNEKFLAVQIEGGSFEEIGKILGELLSCEILVADSKQNLICYFPEHVREQEKWVELDTCGDKIISRALREFAFLHGEGLGVNRTDTEEIWIHGVYVKNKCHGYLYVIGKMGKFNEMSEIAVRQAAVYLALEFSKLGLKEQKEYYQDNNFFLDLISSNVLTEEDALRRAGRLHWPQFPYYMVVSDIDRFEGITRGKEEEEIQAIKDEIMQIHKDVVKQKSNCFFVGNKSDSFHCLFTGQADRKEIRVCMEEIQKQISRDFGLIITTGISREVLRYSDFEKAYKETRTAITIGKKKSKMKICFIDEVQMEEGFFQMAKMDVFQKFVLDSLHILEEYDEKHGSCLLDTLRVLTENQGARKETADSLFLHRNTLAYRIRQIEQLTGYDLNDPQTLFKLQLAIKVNSYIET